MALTDLAVGPNATLPAGPSGPRRNPVAPAAAPRTVPSVHVDECTTPPASLSFARSVEEVVRAAWPAAQLSLVCGCALPTPSCVPELSWTGVPSAAQAAYVACRRLSTPMVSASSVAASPLPAAPQQVRRARCEVVLSQHLTPLAAAEAVLSLLDLASVDMGQVRLVDLRSSSRMVPVLARALGQDLGPDPARRAVASLLLDSLDLPDVPLSTGVVVDLVIGELLALGRKGRKDLVKRSRALVG